MTPEQLVKAYSIAPPPESVAKLASLVAKRESDTKEIVKLIEAEEVLKARLLRAAAPRARHGVSNNTTVMKVEDAILRAGMGCVLLLAMGDPILKAVERTFSSLGIAIELVDSSNPPPLEGSQVVGCIRFSGKANGAVYLRVTRFFGNYIVSTMLGISMEEANDQEIMRDTFGEVCNMVVGNFKSNLCDAGLDCVLSPPEVLQVETFEVERIEGAAYDLFPFVSGVNPLWVEANVKPFE